MTEHDPAGASGAAEGELERLLEAGRAVAPGTARIAKIGGALGVGAAPAAKASLGLTLAMVAGIVVVGALWWLASPRSETTETATETVTATATDPATVTVTATATDPATATATDPATATATATATDPATATATNPATDPATVRAPHARGTALPSTTTTPANAQTTTPAPSVVAPVAQVAPVAPVATPSPIAQPAGPTEASLLVPARAALARAPARTLSLCARHAQLFPRGALAEERDVLSIEALDALGRNAEARARAATFRRTHPGSAHLDRITRVLGE